jgi:hypothetical protein
MQSWYYWPSFIRIAWAVFELWFFCRTNPMNHSNFHVIFWWFWKSFEASIPVKIASLRSEKIEMIFQVMYNRKSVFLLLLNASPKVTVDSKTAFYASQHISAAAIFLILIICFSQKDRTNWLAFELLVCRGYWGHVNASGE